MDIVIRSIDRKVYSKIQRFASQGMQFNMYTENKIELYFYTKYFWYLELNRATQVIAAYMGDRLAGVLLADMRDKSVCIAVAQALFAVCGMGDEGRI